MNLRALVITLLLGATAGRELDAQCPDGAPPPCQRVPRSFSGLAERQPVGVLLYGSRADHLARGDAPRAELAVCAALAILPESTRAWRAPAECTVFSARTALRGEDALDSISSALRASGVRVVEFVPSGIGTTASYARLRTQQRVMVAQRCATSASCDTTFANRPGEVTVLLVRGAPAAIAVYSGSARERLRLGSALARALHGTLGLLAGPSY